MVCPRRRHSKLAGGGLRTFRKHACKVEPKPIGASTLRKLNNTLVIVGTNEKRTKVVTLVRLHYRSLWGQLDFSVGHLFAGVKRLREQSCSPMGLLGEGELPSR